MKEIYKDNKLLFDITICVLVILSLYFVPTYIAQLLFYIISDEYIVSTIANIIYIVLLFIVFYKDLSREFKEFKNNYKNIITKGFKYYIIGILLMVIVNVIIANTLGNISDNETLVREYIVNHKLLALISVGIIAPLSEEIIFRKNITRIINNRWLGSIICALLFGLAHVVDYLDSVVDLVYILPYACLGFSFAFMDYKSNNTFTSMFYHSAHNVMSFAMIILANFMGVL